MTPVLPNANHYTYNLLAMTSSEANRLWRKAIKEANNYECIYCGKSHDENDLTIDHVHPRCMGGCSHTSNQSKGSQHWLTWFRDNFPPNQFRESLILDWIQ